jgi:hypothetical protein
MGLFSFIGGILGGGAQKKASQKATDATVAALNRGIDTQNAFNAQTRADYMPYTTAGAGAVRQLSDFTNGGMSADALSARIMADPLYGSLYNNGEEALLQNAAATGGLRGGNTQRGLADFGADTMAKVYQQILSNLGSVANLGLGAQGVVTGAGQSTANNVSTSQTDIGRAQAGNFLTKGGINAANWQNAGGFLDSAVSSMMPGLGELGSLFGAPTTGPPPG